MEYIVRKSPTDAQKRMIAGIQSFKCANSLSISLSGLETYNCPLWQKAITDNQGSFDQSGFELDHIKELSISGDNSLDNFQALCKSCHSVKTKKFMMKKTNNVYHPIYGKFICKQGEHYIYICDSVAITKNSKMWSKNRPCDSERVNELHQYIQDTGFIDGIIYFANIHGEGLVCYDGNHRREALSNSSRSYKIIINVLEEPSFEYLCKKFISLNKCVPVTELFLDPIENTDIMKSTIMKATDYFCNLWKSHRKTSPNPNRPNFNRDQLQTKIINILDFYNISLETIDYDTILGYINDFNKQIEMRRDNIRFTKSMIDKCIHSGCYLFLEKQI
jgi:hypothetical protein